MSMDERPDGRRHDAQPRQRPNLLAVDLDGTLLRRDSTLAPEGARALAAADAAGVPVILATTRNPYQVRSFARDIGLNHPMICTNGARIWGSPEGPVWIERVIDEALARAVVELADAEDWSLVTTVGTVTYYRQRAGQTLGPMNQHRMVVARNAAALEATDAEQGPVRILCYEAEAIPLLWRFCAENFQGRYHLETYYYPDETVKSLGIYAPGADKGTGLTFVMERLGVYPEQVMAIGDNPNDLPMFSHAGFGVAMGNATAEVKAAASVVAPTNDREGVAWAVRSFVLNREEDR